MGRAVASWTAGRLAVAAVCGGLLAGTSGAAFADAASNILPHRAGYELSLRSVRSGSGIIDVTGLLSYDWTDTCDGWIVEQRYVLQVVRGDGPVVEISASYANWESKDGLRYRFNVKRGHGSEEDSDPSEVQGEASLKGKGKAGTVRFDKPEKQEIALPAGTLFPTEHTLVLIQKAKAGEKFDRHPVFDGAELEGPSMMTAFLLPKRDAPPGGKPSMLTAAQPVWPVTIAVFSEGDKSETPSFEMTIYLQENGVVPEMIMDYGDFSVVGHMKIFEKLPKAEC
jgi:EipB-like